MPSLYATFSNLSAAEHAVSALLAHGVPGRDIHMIANRGQSGQVHDDLSREPGGAAVISTGPPVPARQSLLHGLETLLSVVVRGFGALVGETAAGSTVALAMDEAEHQALSDAVATYFEGRGVPPEVAQQYERTVDEGGLVLEIDFESGKLDPMTFSTLLDAHGGQSYLWNNAPLERASSAVVLPPAEPVVSRPDPTAAILGQKPTSDL